MSFKAVEWALGLNSISPTSKLVLAALCRHTDECDECWPSLGHIARVSGFDRRTVTKHLRILAGAGHITRIRRRKADASHDSSITRINMKPAGESYSLPLGDDVHHPRDLNDTTLGNNVPPNISRESVNKSEVPKVLTQAPTLPDWLPVKIWNDFVQYRRQKKQPLTNHAMELAIKKLAEFRQQGNDPEKVLQQSIMNGWTGVFALSGNKGHDPQSLRRKMPSPAGG